MSKLPGFFITFEGIEGGGKTTQSRRLAERLAAEGIDVVVTREPGGDPLAEAIRRLLLDPANAPVTPEAELLLYAAARAQHVARVIRPALAAGRVVLCDRYSDSTAAYQGGGRGVDHDTLRVLHRVATDNLWPDLTLLFDLDPETGLTRVGGRGKDPDRMEGEDIAFHRRVRAAFLEAAQREPGRFRVIDASRDVDTVADTVWREVMPALDAWRAGRRATCP
ncbi:MAG TPA: dTMP kinase [Candidatus Hydrogenedentes bacterium]|nr:dTMP kinase [Candidatus Hydrogenedentota bacterium]HOV59631.1 dTMP kinase [Candidatus Hydrogenedentota bacterium]